MPLDWFSPAQCFGYLVHFGLLGNPTAVASSFLSMLRSVLALRTRSAWVSQAAAVSRGLLLKRLVGHRLVRERRV